MSKSVLVVLAFVLCVFATAMMRDGPLELSDVGERIAISVVWVAGVAYIIWTIAKNSS